MAPITHPLAALDRVTVHDLAEHDLLLEPPGTAFRDDLDAQASDAGVTLTTKAEVDGMRLVASLAFEGFGAAILPVGRADLADRRVEAWSASTVCDAPPVGLVRRRRGLPSAPARALTEVLRRVVAEEAALQPGIHPATTG